MAVETTRQDLVFDLGLHRGEDTRYYLKKGFRVVGVDANETLIEECRKEFADAIASGRAMLVHAAIVPDDYQDGSITFYENEKKSVFGTVDPAWAERNESLGFPSKKIVVPAIRMRDLFAKYGVPHYLKIDIEGMDLEVLRGLAGQNEIPKFLSFESNKVSLDKIDEELSIITSCGYRKYAAVQQQYISRQERDIHTLSGDVRRHRFPEGSSGPFGDDLSDLSWVDADGLRAQYREIFKRYEKWGDATPWETVLPLKAIKVLISRALGKPLPGWYDTHATF